MGSTPSGPMQINRSPFTISGERGFRLSPGHRLLILSAAKELVLRRGEYWAERIAPTCFTYRDTISTCVAEYTGAPGGPCTDP